MHRIVDRLGLFWQLLLPSLLAIVLSVAMVQAWTLRVSQDALEQRMQHSLTASMALLKAYLAPLGAEWSQQGGRLGLGSTPVAARDDLVDQAAQAAGGVATIFSDDERVATTVRKPDGSRAVGTKLTDPAVREAVLRQGKTFRGAATILGTPYLTIYEPIRDQAGQVIGILFTGLPRTELDAAKTDILQQAALAGGSVVLLFMAIGTWLLVLALRPLNHLAAATRQIADGALDTVVPSLHRRDQIGRLAGALQQFKNAAANTVRLEASAVEQRLLRETARQQDEAALAAAAVAQATVVTSLASGLERLAGGDLTFRLEQAFTAPNEPLRANFNTATEQLQQMMRSIASNAGTLRSGTDEIVQATDDLSRRTEQQAASLEQTAAALDEITATVRNTADGAKRAQAIVSLAKASAEQSGDVVRQAVAAMGGIEQSSQQIGQIIGVMDEIAFQTNLLALNAGVEAARAGDSGRGFAVVASEVRALAQRSAAAAREIKVLIATSVQQVGAGVRLVGATGTSLVSIVAQVGEINVAVSGIAASAQEQAAALHQVNTAINQMDQVTQQNATMVEQTTAASHSLALETEQLAHLTERFKLIDTAGPVRRRTG